MFLKFALPEKIAFMKVGRLAFYFSVFLSLSSVLSIFIKGFNLGLDFTGGTVVEVEFNKTVDINHLRNVFSTNGFKDAQVQFLGQSLTVMVRLPPSHHPVTVTDALNPGDQKIDAKTAVKIENKAQTEKIADLFNLAYPSHTINIKKIDVIGPQVGDELRDKSGIAMIVALICMCLYVALRFQYKFSLGALAALVHDTLITLGIFSFFSLPFDLNVLAAVLGVIGYSLNDTIVVFDRIRENFAAMRDETTSNIIDISITQTLGRTLMTSICTLLVLLAMLILGGDALFGFSLALTIGIVVGTYSSYYIASYMLVLTKLNKNDFAEATPKDDYVEEDYNA